MRPLLLALLLAVPCARAAAQACEEGRVSRPETAGRCCWPGQTWSEAHARCSGPPACPEALVAHADDCVARILRVPAAPPGYAPMVEDFDGVPEEPAISTSVAPAIAPTIARDGGLPVAPGTRPSGPATATVWPPTPPELELALFAPRLERGTDDGLLLAGLLTFAGGYIVGIVGAAIDEAAQNCNDFSFSFRSVSCESWPLGFVPIAGGVAAGTVNWAQTMMARSSSRSTVAVGLGIGIPAGLIQLFGLVLTSLAAAGHTDRAVSGGRPEGVEISVTPWGDAHGGGAWVDVRF